MCADPMTIAMIGMQVGQGVMAQNAAVTQANQQNAMYQQNVVNSREAMLNDVRSLNRRQDQESKATAQKKFDLNLEAEQKKATAGVAAGEGGVAGSSVQRLLDSYDRSRSVAQGTINRNFDMVAEEIAGNKEATKSTFTSRVNSVKKGYAPSALQAGLGIAMNVGSTLAMGSTGLKEGESLFGKDAWNRGAKRSFGKNTSLVFS